MADKNGIMDKVVSAYKSAKQSVSGAVDMAKQLSQEASGVTDKTKNVEEYTKPVSTPAPVVGTTPTKSQDRLKGMPKDVKNFKEGTSEVKDQKTESVMWGTKGKGYAEGTDTVPAMLTPGERVVKASDNKKLKGMSNMRLVEAALAHKKQEAKEPAAEEKHETPAKELKELRIRKTANNGAIVEHHHTHPDVHQMEEHTVANKKQLAQHIMQHMDGMDSGEDTEGE